MKTSHTEGQVDADTNTRAEYSDAIPETISHSAKSGKRNRMQLRRRSKIKVFVISLFVLALHVCASTLN